MIMPIVRGGWGMKNYDKYHNFEMFNLIFFSKNDDDIIRGGGRGSESYDRNYHR